MKEKKEMEELNLHPNYYTDLSINISVDEWIDIARGIDILLIHASIHLLNSTLCTDDDPECLQSLLAFKSDLDQQLKKKLTYF